MKLELTGDWTLSLLSDYEIPTDLDLSEVAATVPGCVHTDLLAQDLIPDPYYGENENDLQWIGHNDWVYSRSFEVNEALLSAERMDLVCDGLDTVATIELNGQRIAETENMHVGYRFDAKPFLQKGSNTIRITFQSALNYGLAQRERLGYLPTSSYPYPFNFVRKMACNFGWDWGPTLITAGIWQNIYLEAWADARIASLRPLVMQANDKEATVNVHVDVEGEIEGLELHYRLLNAKGREVASKSSADQSAQLIVSQPQLWWPRGHGKQPLYMLEVTLSKGDRILDVAQSRLGLREIKLDTSPDDIGAKFVLHVNGKPIFCKGANWIPDDCFVTRVDEARYFERITQAVDANMNMLRIWGGGIYETDTFYDICDELGVLVWQDFLFACACYPEEEPFSELAEAEARYNVARLANHPSLVLWNGNNENLWGYLDWELNGKTWREWSEGRTWGAGFYFELFPNILAELDPSRPYTPGSPYSDPSGLNGLHPLADNYGTKHVWDAWNRFDYLVYRNYIPRFASEFGHQAPPTFATLLSSIPADELHPDSAAMLHHQKANGGNLKLHRRLSEHFAVPEGFQDWLYLTQLNQARALKTGCEWFRANAPRTMGALYWQLNDCWPVTSWAAVDGYGRKKLLWYATRQFFADRLLCIQPKGDKHFLVIINDHDETWDVKSEVTRRTFGSEVLASEKLAADIEPRSVVWLELPSTVSQSIHKQDEFVLAEADGKRTTWYFDIDKRLNYHKPQYDAELKGDTLTITAKTFLRDLCVFADMLEPSASASEQLVTLLPGETWAFKVTNAQLLDGRDLSKAIFCANSYGVSAR